MVYISISNDSTMSTRTFHCYICGISFKDIRELQHHEQVQHATLRCCHTHCRQVLPNLGALFSHERALHVPLKCVECGTTVNGSSGIPEHLTHSHGHVAPMMCVCTQCNVFFGNQVDWAAHMTGCANSKSLNQARVSKSVLYEPRTSEKERTQSSNPDVQHDSIISYVRRLLEDMKEIPREIATS